MTLRLDFLNYFFLFKAFSKDELRQLVSEAQRYLETMDNGPDIPITDWIVNYVAEQFSSDDTKTTDQLRRRMMKMGLIQKIQKRPKSFATINRRESREVMGLELRSIFGSSQFLKRIPKRTIKVNL